MSPSTSADRRRDVALAIVSTVLIVTGGVMVAVQRASLEQYLYVSELGAEGMPTAGPFRVGFVCVAVAIAIAAFVLRPMGGAFGQRWLRPSYALAVSAAMFLAASQITCTDGCPALTTPEATVQDWTHVVFAVVGFVAGCAAMLECAVVGSRRMRATSILCAVAIACVATLGGLISLFEGNTDIGSTLEFVASGLGLLWLIGVQIVELADVAPAAPAATA